MLSPRAIASSTKKEKFGSGQAAPVDPFQRLEEIWDRRIGVITRLLKQHLEYLEPGARQ